MATSKSLSRAADFIDEMKANEPAPGRWLEALSKSDRQFVLDVVDSFRSGQFPSHVSQRQIREKLSDKIGVTISIGRWRWLTGSTKA